jgi:protein involved in polysaccharide export with SLBB domain
MRVSKRRCVGASVSLALGSVLGGCSAVGYPIADLAAEINATRDQTRTVLAAGDVVRVNFPEKAEWNVDVRIRPDGFATFPSVDDVPAAGLTLAELDSRLSALYLKKAAGNADSLTVDLLGGAMLPAAAGGVPPDAVFVVGDVERPGPVPMTGRPWTLFEAIAAAGGHRKATANLRNTLLIRRLATGRMQGWRLDAGIYDWGSQPPIFLQPRDVVFVPNSAIDEVNIWVDKYIRQMLPLPIFPVSP